MKKVIIISRHIHSGSSTFQSGDEFLKLVINSKDCDFEPGLNERISSTKFPFLNGLMVEEFESDKKYIGIYLESDKTFYYRAMQGNKPFEGYSSTPEFKELISSYIEKGFKKRVNVPEQETFKKAKKRKEQAENKRKGIVLWMDYDEHKKDTSLYQGGFSDEVFNSPQLQNYIKTIPYGWIGSYDRTFYADKLIEKGLRKRGISPSKMVNWITSSSGRHFGDSLGGYSKKEQKEKIEEGLNYMYNCCVNYGIPSHGGMLKDTVRINGFLKEYKILLDTNKKYSPKEHLKNLFDAKEKLSKIQNPEPDEAYLIELVGDLFTNLV